MSREEYAIVVSVLSLCVACLALGWNIYRDVILKARVRTSLRVGRIVSGNSASEPLVFVSVVNTGPGPVTCNSVLTRTRSLWRILTRSVEMGVTMPDFAHPMCHRLPATLDIAEEITLVFPIRPGSFLEHGISDVGVGDSFGRIHWVPRKQVRNAIEEHKTALLKQRRG